MVKYTLFLVWLLSMAIESHAQSNKWLPIDRLAVSYQKSIGLDLGLIAFSTVWNDSKFAFFDASLGAESIFQKPFVLSPKVNVDAGFALGKFPLTFGGGVDLARPTDFSGSAWMLTPKLGLTWAGVLRLYYAQHMVSRTEYFPNIGRHRVALELHLPIVFHGFRTIQ